MTLWQKRAWIQTALWILAAAGFLAFSLADEGPAGLIKHSARRNAAAGFVVAGLAAHFVVRHLTRNRPGRQGTLVDERDEHIQLKSSEIALGTTTAGVFLACIALGDAFTDLGQVPVNWLWFMAWSTLIATHLVQAVVAVVMYSGVFSRGQG